MKLLDRLQAREIVRTNSLGARTTYRIGAIVDGYRITRHKTYATTPDSTVVVYGVRA